ncbi:MAG: branched-chain amino acid aminotransferase [Bacteroidales bacterium]|nr:branched-chain amino acid aminotransferase [Bacteroidales bacterium]
MATELDWSSLGFHFRQTNKIVVSYYKDGQWSAPVATEDFSVALNCFANTFHYGSSCFEGLKAFRGQDGKVRIFRPEENAKRLQSSAERLGLGVVPEQMFIDMCVTAVRENLEFLPPYGYNASMYIRPVLIGTTPGIGVCSSEEAVFIVMVSPVGTYSGKKSLTPLTATVARNYDRAAPNGTGRFKVSANYAISLYPYNMAHKQGYGELIFLDPATHKNIDEFGSSNFLAIQGNKYITPLSDSILPSITNKTLQQVAQDFGLTVEKRVIPLEEVAEFDEINACGTAVVITPIKSIDDKARLEDTTVVKTYHMPSGEEVGKTSKKLYDRIRGIQDGREEDTHNWCLFVD